jgi:hypothetical protein
VLKQAGETALWGSMHVLARTLCVTETIRCGRALKKILENMEKNGNFTDLGYGLNLAVGLWKRARKSVERAALLFRSCASFSLRRIFFHRNL